MFRRIYFPAILLTAGLSCFAAPAQAAYTQMWVSGRGVDTATCGTLAAPCRTLQYAHNLIPDGGELAISDSGNLGAVSITKSIRITNTSGGTASVIQGAAGRAAITISGNSYTGEVIITGLNIDGVGNGDTGILIYGGVNVTISKCLIKNFKGSGLKATGGSNLLVEDTLSAGNGLHGFMLSPISSMKASFSRVTADANMTGSGLGVDTGASFEKIMVSVKDSTFTNNANGVGTFGSRAPAEVSILNSSMSGNSTGLSSSGSGYISISGSILVGNNYGYSTSGGGAIFTAGNNTIRNNRSGDSSSSSLTTYSLK